MKKEELLTDEFLKQFKSGEELNSFLQQIQKRGIEKMLEGEMDVSTLVMKRTESVRLPMPATAMVRKRSKHL